MHARVAQGDATVRAGLEKFIERTRADELMIISDIFDPQKRLRSFEIVAEVLGYKSLELVATGGNTEEERKREQWNDGNNVLCLRPGVVP